MRKHQGTWHRRRPEIELLEGRWLLSGLSGGLTGVSASPAQFAPTRRPISPADEPRPPLVISPSVHSETDYTGATDGDEMMAVRTSSPGKLQAATATGRTTGPIVVARTSESHDDDPAEELALAGPALRAESWLTASVRNAERPAGASPALPGVRLTIAPGIAHAEPHDGPILEPQDGTPETAACTATRRLLNSVRRPQPRGFGLIDRVLPFAEDSLSQAVDRIFDHFEQLAEPTGLRPRGAARILPPLALALVGAGLEAARRRLRETADSGHEERSRGPYGRFGQHDLPGMPRF